MTFYMRKLSWTAMDMLDDIHKIEVDGRRPDRADLRKVLKARNPNMSEDTIEDAIAMIIQLLIQHRLVIMHHDSLGYPYWNLTERGIVVLSETRNR